MRGEVFVKRGLVLAAALVACVTVAEAGTLEDVRERGTLRCGVSEGLGGFSQLDGNGDWRGFDVDFCKAVAAAVLGDGSLVEFVPLSTNARFTALSRGQIDLLSRNSTWTMSRDLGLGLSFAGVSYFDGQGFLVKALYGVTSPYELDGVTVCVVSGTTTERNAAAFFAEAGLQASFLRFDERSQARAAYANDECDAYTADRSALAAERSQLAVPDDHVVLRDVISKEPLGPVTRDDDPLWTDLVRWTLYGLITAEEKGLTAEEVTGRRRWEAAALGAPGVATLGVSVDWLVKAIAEVGHYGEVFERNLGEQTPLGLRRGLNAQWTEGGLIYAPPMP